MLKVNFNIVMKRDCIVRKLAMEGISDRFNTFSYKHIIGLCHFRYRPEQAKLYLFSSSFLFHPYNFSQSYTLHSLHSSLALYSPHFTDSEQ